MPTMGRVAAGVAMATAAGPSAMAAGRGLAGALRRAMVATFLAGMKITLRWLGICLEY